MKLKINLLKIAMLFIALFCTTIGVLLVFNVINELYKGFSFIGVLLILAIVFSLFFGYLLVFYLFKILDLVQKNQPFTKEILTYIVKVKWGIIGIGLSFLGILPFALWVGEKEDAPGVILFSLFICGVPWAIFIFSQVVEYLFKSAIFLQEENELTI